MGGLGVKFQHFPLTLLVVLTTLTLPCERDVLCFDGFSHFTWFNMSRTTNDNRCLIKVYVIVIREKWGLTANKGVSE